MDIVINEIINRLNEKQISKRICKEIKQLKIGNTLVFFDICIILELHKQNKINNIIFVSNDKNKIFIAKELNCEIIETNDIFDNKIYERLDQFNNLLSNILNIKSNIYKYKFIFELKKIYDETNEDVYIGKQHVVYKGKKQFKSSRVEKKVRIPAQYELYNNIFVYINYSNNDFKNLLSKI